jgi:TrmH family RNA methyltransferase
MDAKDFRRQDFSRKIQLKLQHSHREIPVNANRGKIAPMPPASQQLHSRIVQSRQNPRVKELRASLSGKSRTSLVGIEGEHLVAEAIRSGIEIISIFFRTGSNSLLDHFDLSPDTEIIELPADIFASAVTTESPQGIAALVETRTCSLEDVLLGDSPLLVVAAALQDPGNLGTLIRSAEAFGATGVITLPGTVSPWNPKALRASSGSAFRLPIVSANEEAVLTRLRAAAIKVLAAVADDGHVAPETDLTGPIAILIGNEGSGLSSSTIDQADIRIKIPCPGPVESLNAAVAASILLYEASRQRTLAKSKA